MNAVTWVSSFYNLRMGEYFSPSNRMTIMPLNLKVMAFKHTFDPLSVSCNDLFNNMGYSNRIHYIYKFYVRLFEHVGILWNKMSNYTSLGVLTISYLNINRSLSARANVVLFVYFLMG